MIENLSIITILFISASAVPFFARRLKIPSATLEIIVGLFAFKISGIYPPEWFNFFKELGLIYLMFLAGMELEFERLTNKRMLCFYLVITGLPFIINPFISASFGMPFFIGIAASVMSAGVVIPVIRELKLSEHDFGKTLITLSLTGEVVSIAVLTGFDIYQKSGVSFMALVDVVKLIALLSLSALFLKGLYYFSWWYSEKIESVMESEDPVEEGLRAIVAIIFSGALVAYLSGIEPVLGSFITGAIFSYVFKSKGVFHEKINGLGYGFFIPMFFIGIGAELQFTVRVAKEVIAIIILLLTGSATVIVFSKKIGITLKQSMLASLLLSAPLSMMIVASTIGLRIGLINKEIHAAVVMASVIAGIVYPFLFRLFSQKLLTFD